MAILGMQQSGKTLWWNVLTGGQRGGQTTEEEIETFVLEFSENRTLYVRKGIDIGGMKEKIMKYKEMVEKMIVFYFFLYKGVS